MSEELKEILEFDFETLGERIEINEYERNKIKDYIINLQQENKQLKERIEELENQLDFIDEQNKYINKLEKRIDKAIYLLQKEIDSCNSALSNPEYTICCKHELLKQEKNELIKSLEILKGE